MKKRVNGKCNKGFTLVELIVVLVILAILAAILIPMLFGWIDKAKEKKYIYNAKNCMTAAQGRLVELYGLYGNKIGENQPVISGGKTPTSKNGDVDVTQTQFAKDVLELADMSGDNAPYCFMIGVGSNQVNSQAGKYNVTTHDKYTVYYAFYMETKDSTPLYYYNGEWTKSNPRVNDSDKIVNGYNVFKSGPLKGKRIQYYLITNKTGKGSVETQAFWSWLKAMK